ncbi:hypothetical protein NZL82_01475 [Sphingomonas sanguinis]|uniref:hypothetical protein n=1 Tax=Sphingomonas sp. LC-1 TaxID=3110957 RepID=UPI0021BAE5D1|nr:hypothetical protein [Sphingomonas sp. LC-1]MCT8000541.1 hypothetical protein [Sphingomonas sp. LC-1]
MPNYKLMDSAASPTINWRHAAQLVGVEPEGMIELMNIALSMTAPFEIDVNAACAYHTDLGIGPTFTQGQLERFCRDYDLTQRHPFPAV